MHLLVSEAKALPLLQVPHPSNRLARLWARSNAAASLLQPLPHTRDLTELWAR